VYPPSKIVGGTQTALGGRPFQAAIVIGGSGLCGGSLISTTVVLTAKHCTVET
jgi:secreted trypsin-like serine protease